MPNLRRIMLLVTTWMLIALPAQAAVPPTPPAVPATPVASQSIASDDDSVEFVRRLGGRYDSMHIDGTIAYLLGDGVLMSVNIANPAQPVILDQMALALALGFRGKFSVVDGYVYIIDQSRAFRIVDIHDPANLTLEGTYPAVNEVPNLTTLDFQIQGQYGYLVTREPSERGTNRLRIIDIANPAQPVETGMVDLTPGTGEIKMAVAEDFVYLATVTTSEIQIVNVADRHAPMLVGTLVLQQEAAGIYGLEIEGQRLYVHYDQYLNHADALEIFDLAIPNEPTKIGTYSHAPFILLAVEGFRMYIDTLTTYPTPDNFVMQTIDLTNPAAPVVGGLINTGSRYVYAVQAQDEYVYILADSHDQGKLSIVDFSNAGAPQIRSQTVVSTVQRPSNLTISGDSLYVINNVRPLPTFQRYSLANPLDPAPVSTTPLGHPATSMVVSGEWAYVSTPSNTIYVIDLNSPAAPLAVTYPGPGMVLNIQIIGADGPRVYVYIVADEDRFEVLDFSTPNAPQVLGGFALDMYYWHPPVVAGGVAWFIQQQSTEVPWSTCIIRGIDLSDPASMHEIASFTLPETTGCYGAFQLAAASDNALYLTTAIYASAYFSLQAIDISNPAQPVAQAALRLNSPIQSISTNDRYLYADMAGGVEVVVFDHSTPSRLFQVGSFKLAVGYSGNSPIGGPGDGIVAHNGIIYHGSYGLSVLRARTLLASGTIRHANGLPFAGGATISASSGASRTSAPDGGFRFQDLPRGTLTFTPNLSGYGFWPPQQTLDLPPNRWLEFQVTTAPLAASLPPGSITTLAVTDTQGLPTTFQLDASALSTTSSVAITPTPRLHTLAGWAFSGHGFELKLEQSLPVTTTIRYSAADVRLARDLAALEVWRWSGTTWEAAACAGPAVHTPATQTISVGLCQSGSYGLFAPTNQLFLPIVATQ